MNFKTRFTNLNLWFIPAMKTSELISMKAGHGAGKIEVLTVLQLSPKGIAWMIRAAAESKGEFVS